MGQDSGKQGRLIMRVCVCICAKCSCMCVCVCAVHEVMGRVESYAGNYFILFFILAMHSFLNSQACIS